MKNYSKEDMEEGLDCYRPETRVFPKIAKAEGPQKLKKQDVLLILKWKLGRIKESNCKTVSDDNLRQINQSVEKSGETAREIEALKELDKIPGIGLATATAILTVCYPDKFTILDYRVLETLDLEPSNTDSWTAEQYFEEYLPRVKEQCGQWDCTLRQADRALWGLSVRDQIKNITG
jgi:endonuclease III